MRQAVLPLIVAAVLATLLFQRWLLEALIEAIRHFRGGPPSSMPPLPSNDTALLRKRLRKIRD